MTLHFNVIR